MRVAIVLPSDEDGEEIISVEVEEVEEAETIEELAGKKIDYVAPGYR